MNLEAEHDRRSTDGHRRVAAIRFLFAIGPVSSGKRLQGWDCLVVSLTFASWNRFVP